MKTDYLGKVDTGIGSFFREVSKEIIHQTTGHDFAEEEKKSVLSDTTEACADAIGSAHAQQTALEAEMSEYDNSIDDDLLVFYEVSFDLDNSDNSE